MSSHLDDLALSRLIDDDLSLTTRAAVLGHLEQCPACAQRHDDMVAVAATLRLQTPVEWSEAMSVRVLTGLPARKHPVRAAVAAALSVGLFVVALADVAPLIASMLAVAGVLAAVAVAVVPAPVSAGGAQLLAGVALVAVAAPLIAYPLAKWR
jgi:anti-sigma factor RsiW